MAQYIDKDALVAEIEKRMERAKFEAQQAQENNDYVSCVGWSEHFATCGDILRIINTLEVKEVDLEEAIDDYIYTHNGRKRLALELDWKCCNLTLKGGDEIIKFAKHFFGLGLKTQKL